MPEPIIKLENVWKIYQLGKVELPALRGIDLEIAPGSFVSIMGPSGSGKSTLLNMIGALDFPTRGKVILKGKDMVCYLPLGVVATPENNPNICTGKLKEEMQSLIIQKLHEYIVQNLGEISNEIAQIEGVGNVNAGEIVVNSSA